LAGPLLARKTGDLGILAMAFRISALNLREQYQKIGPEIESAVINVLRSGNYILSEQGARLESEVAKMSGCKHGIGVANCSDALHLALWCLNIGHDDEVITTPFTFAATVAAIALRGAKPVFVDVDEKTYNINPDLIEAAINHRTKAIMPVHLFGLPCDMDPINAIARKHSLKVIEDGAQSIGARYKGKPSGSMGDIASISFYPTKNLGACGDAGMLVTNDDTLAERLRALRTHGMRKRYYHDELGLNSRLDEVQAAVLNTKTPYLQLWNASRQLVAECYDKALRNIPGIALPAIPSDGLSPETDTFHTWHQYTIRILTDQVEQNAANINTDPLVANLRDEVMAKLADKGIGTMCYYPVPLHLQSAFAHFGYKVGDFPVTEKLANQVISLPMYPELTEAEVKSVAEAIRDVLAEITAPAIRPATSPVYVNQ
jgi:dTDP-4-amino-4,6-dideoxygalactose transaminase